MCSIDNAVRSVSTQMHISEPEGRIWAMRRLYSQAMEAARYGDLISEKSHISFGHLLKKTYAKQTLQENFGHHSVEEGRKVWRRDFWQVYWGGGHTSQEDTDWTERSRYTWVQRRSSWHEQKKNHSCVIKETDQLWCHESATAYK